MVHTKPDCPPVHVLSLNSTLYPLNKNFVFKDQVVSSKSEFVLKVQFWTVSSEVILKIYFFSSSWIVKVFLIQRLIESLSLFFFDVRKDLMLSDIEIE